MDIRHTRACALFPGTRPIEKGQRAWNLSGGAVTTRFDNTIGIEMKPCNGVPLTVPDTNGQSILIDKIRYDFRSSADAEAFVRVIATGTPPQLAYALLSDRRIFAFLDH